MAIWTVWEHDKFGDDAKKAERALFVRDGFACLAFLTGPLWLVYHRMVLVLIAYIAVVGAANVAAADLLGDNAAFLISLVLSLWFGFEATALRRWTLARRGWRLVGVVEARRRIEAERRYFEDRLAGEDDADRVPAGTMMPWGAPAPPPVLGLFPEGPR